MATKPTPRLQALGGRLQAARQLASLAQDDLAGSLGVRVRTIQRWEAGDTEIGALSVCDWAATCEVTVQWLVAGEQGSPPQLTARALERIADQLERSARAIRAV